MLTIFQLIMTFVAPTMAIYQLHPRAMFPQSCVFGLVVMLTFLAFLGVRS